MNNFEEKETVKEVKEIKGTLVLTYGTLRLNHGNFRGCIKPYMDRGQARHIATIKTPAEYNMYSLGGFPGVVKGGETAITADLFEIESPECLQGLNYLEGHVSRDNPRNFYNTTDVETEFGTALMYVLDSGRGEDRIVASGDWEDR
jgi:gamma-glutamylcyclotransferase (GGCT)/AIG2-like uncharacterized protein YtfP